MTQFSVLAQVMQRFWQAVGLIIVIALIVIVIIFLMYIKIYLQALFSGARVPLLSLVGMTLRKISAGLIVGEFISLRRAGITNVLTPDLESVFLVRRHVDDLRICVTALITAHKASLEITFNELQSHHFAGGNVFNLVKSLIAANRANIKLDLNVGRAIDLAGRDILDAVQTSVNPKVIDCPSPAATKGTIDAVAKDGIQLKARARVTVRTNIKQLIGGATEETVVARVGEGIVTSIGSANNYKEVLESPDSISRNVLAKGLDAGTAFEILSIDIADVDVGDNIGAQLQADQAEADKRRFQAEAEKRRALAVAQEQEYNAEVQKNRALVVLAEAEVPKAMAEAFRSGNLGIMDYYRMRNIQADTSMRDSIGREGEQRNGGAGPKSES